MTGAWHSQRVPALGAIKGTGITNQLGTPEADPLTILVREAAQNSWDARDTASDGPVRFAMQIESFGGERAEAWATVLLQDAPADHELPLSRELDDAATNVLFVSDRGTTGLGGPTRADEAVQGEPHDYVSFVLNVGDPRDTEYGGGTYGFGKAVFYRLSPAGTVLIHSRCRDEHGEIESRVIGCALGPSFERDGVAHTGRHWFGSVSEDLVEPLRGQVAEDLVRDLGFPPFASGELGTTVAVVQPKFGGRPLDEAGRYLANSILWHLWPKMLATRGDSAPMEFSVSVNGADVEIPDPRRHRVLSEFVMALDRLNDEGEIVAYGPGARSIGRLTLRTAFSALPDLDEVAQLAGLVSGIHHCCLVRTPELVVEYRSGPPLPDPHVWYCGIFKPLDEFDELFASAEPPTHDAWVASSLEGTCKSIVRTTLRKIDEALRKHAAVGQIDNGTAHVDGEGLAAASRYFGGLLAPADGEGAGPEESTGGESGSRILRLIGPPQWDVLDSDQRDILTQEFEILVKRAVDLEAGLSVRVWGGGEKEAPLGAARPKVLGWTDSAGTFVRGDRLSVGVGQDRKWRAVVEPVADSVTRISVSESKVNDDG